MNIGITGKTGFIGSRLAVRAVEQGHEVTGFSRRHVPGSRLLSTQSEPDLSGLDAMINLAGESIFGLWTPEKKRRIYESRVQGTKRIVEAMATDPKGPKILISASAIGFYGETGEQIATEESPEGSGFLAEVCAAWEAEAMRAAALGVRVVLVRTGFVLGAGGGALGVIRPVFSFGGGGKLGSGRQWMSGVHVDDVAGIYLWALENEGLAGPVNAVMPEPFRNAEFTKAVAAELHRPAIAPAPAFVLRTVMGEMSHLLLDSVRVVPGVARSKGYQFLFPDLKGALAQALK